MDPTKTAADIQIDRTVYWPYNETTKQYHCVPLAGKRAKLFVEQMNKSSTDRWILHTPAQYDEYWKTAKVAQEFLWNKP